MTAFRRHRPVPSSGTTGLPKGVTKPFVAEPLETAAIGVVGVLQLLFGMTADSVYLSPAPLYHAAPLAAA